VRYRASEARSALRTSAPFAELGRCPFGPPIAGFSLASPLASVTKLQEGLAAVAVAAWLPTQMIPATRTEVKRNRRASRDMVESVTRRDICRNDRVCGPPHEDRALGRCATATSCGAERRCPTAAKCASASSVGATLSVALSSVRDTARQRSGGQRGLSHCCPNHGSPGEKVGDHHARDGHCPAAGPA
jgi:hypothetical protein